MHTITAIDVGSNALRMAVGRLGMGPGKRKSLFEEVFQTCLKVLEQGEENMNLYIVRHAIAVERETSGYDHDSQRLLTDAGSKKMKKIAKGLQQLGIELDVILSSPYVRARDTAAILAKRFELDDKVAFSDNLIPPGNFGNLVNEIREKYDVNNLALVGHEPMLSSLISWLTTGNTDMKVTLKKGGVAYLTADHLSQDGRATLQWLLTPALMVELAK